VRLSRESRYAILALVELARHDEREIVEARTLARAAHLPTPFLRKILAMLASAGVLESYRGRGYRLARQASTIRLAEILEAVGDDAFGDGRCIFWREECSVDDPCPLHFRWRELRPTMELALGGFTLEQIREHGPDTLPIPLR
jgi:Rrf2 family iron-sulfur cluster assembly transcriptional regulator